MLPLVARRVLFEMFLASCKNLLAKWKPSFLVTFQHFFKIFLNYHYNLKNSLNQKYYQQMIHNFIFSISNAQLSVYYFVLTYLTSWLIWQLHHLSKKSNKIFSSKRNLLQVSSIVDIHRKMSLCTTNTIAL